MNDKPAKHVCGSECQDPGWVEPLPNGEYLGPDGSEDWCHECGHRSKVVEFPVVSCGHCGSALSMIPKLKVVGTK